jgi:hypothetical protein
VSEDLFAHARNTDPDTSHEAAAAVTPGLRELQIVVARHAKRCGERGFTDLEMEEALGDSGSTYRTRRSELTARNVILDSGRRRTHGESGRQRIVWLHRDFVPDAPPVCDPPKAVTNEDVLRAREMATEMRRWAKQMRSEGRTRFCDMLEEAADLMGRMAAAG